MSRPETADAAAAAGAKRTVHEMTDVGHAFPSSKYPVVREWLYGPRVAPDH